VYRSQSNDRMKKRERRGRVVRRAEERRGDQGRSADKD
jgi:hypothetical protein